MRILHIISSADPRGGGPIEGIHQRGLVLQAQGHSVELLTLDAPDSPHVAAMPFKVHATGPKYSSYGWTPRFKPWLRVHAGDYDAIVISGLWQYHGWAASQVLRQMGLPYHLFTHGMLDPWFKQHYPLKHLKKWAYWLLAEYHVLRHARAVLFTSEEEMQRASQSFWLYAARGRVVDYGTSTPPDNGTELRQAFRRAHPDLQVKRLVLFLSRIHEKKGCDLLLQAFASAIQGHPDLHLLMAGPAEPAVLHGLQQQAKALGLESRVTWLGMVSGAAKWQALYGADVFVLPSHQENFGIAVVEALGCGLPVLISDKVNIWREVVADGAGMVAPDTAEGTLSNLTQWLSLSPDKLQAMARKACATFEKRYTAEASARSLLDVLQSPPRQGAAKGSGLRILHVVTSVDPQLGGVAESIRSRGVKLVEMGHLVEVVSLDPSEADFAKRYPLPLHALGPGHTKWQFHGGLVPWLKGNCQRFDAVVVDGLWQYHGMATRRALAGTGVPYFVFPHGMLDPWFKRTYPLKHLKKWMVWPWADYRVLRDAKAVLFTCDEERILAKQSFWLYRANERLAPLGTTEPPRDSASLTERFYTAFPAVRGKPFLLFLGRIHPKKGCDLLLSAFAATAADFPAQHLVMAGPGEPTYLASLQTQAQQLGIEQRVHWLGMIKGDVKWGAMYASDAFVLPSHQENFGIAVVEALACAKPVLTSDKVNIWREIAADRCGLVEPDTEVGTIALLRGWLPKPTTERNAMAASARECYERRYTVSASAQALLNAMTQVEPSQSNA